MKESDSTPDTPLPRTHRREGVDLYPGLGRPQMLATFWTLALYCAVPCPAAAAASAAAETPLVERVQEQLRRQFEETAHPAVADVAVVVEALGPFYRNREYRPAWVGPEGVLAEADSLLEAVRTAESQGLVPADYHLPQILSRLAAIRPERLAELDVLLSDAFLRYCLDVRSGRSDPRDADPEWFVFADGLDHMGALEAALADDSLHTLLGTLYPPDPRYARLRQALATYRAIAARGGWPALEGGGALKAGLQEPSVAVLRQRLRATGDLNSEGGGELFDEDLENALRGFQLRHGLDSDGVVGVKTRHALNRPVEERIQQIILNLERWRWMPRALGRRHILVNMAGFELRVFEDEEATLSMRVVVGRTYRRTPAFDGSMSYLVLSPYWNVPTSLATRDILPKVQKDPDYLQQQGIHVFSDWSENARELDPLAIDWSQISSAGFPYKLRQDPGPMNALGRVKFMFPNRFNVYLHDTPHRELFDRTVRTFSSGCIRLERPLELADYVLRGADGWSPGRIRSAVDGGQRKVVRLPEPLTVFLVYWTAWVEKEGMVHFRDDVYGRDKLLREALARGVPEGLRWTVK